MPKERETDQEELERQSAEVLPDREALSLLDAGSGIIGGSLVDPLGSGGLPTDSGTGEGGGTQILPVEGGTTPPPTATPTSPVTPLTGIANDVAETAAEAGASDADADTTLAEGGGGYSNSDTAVSET